MNTSSLRRAALPAVAVLTVGLSLAACGDKSGGSGNTLNGGGATSQQNAQTAWRAAYQKSNSGTSINYELVGSGTGVTNFTSKAYSFAGTDAYLTADQLSAATKTCGGDPVEVPAYVSPIAVAFNLPGVKTLNLDAKTIADIFNGTITKWNDPAIAQQNPKANLPGDAIATVHRSDDSGTTNNFTDYLSKASDGAWKDPASSTWPASLSGKGQGFDGTSGVVGALTGTKDTIGYADDSAVSSATPALGVVSIKVGNDYNAPSATGAAQVLEASPAAPGQPATSMATDIDRTATAKGDYPLMLASYLLACQKYSDSKTADAVKGYLTYIVSAEGQQAAASAAGSAPLTSALSQKATAIVSKIASGS